MSREPWHPATFEQRYRAAEDPWDFAASPYEQERYAALLATLGDRRYRAAYEPGCSVGVLTELLAPRCRSLLATDVSPTAVARARARCAAEAGVTTAVQSVTDPPPGSFDLVVFSELGYYFDEAQLATVLAALDERLEPGGDLVACHWLGTSEDHRLGGATVHGVVQDVVGRTCERQVRHRAPGYLLERWRRR